MANKETSKFGLPEPSFVKIIGMGEGDTRELRTLLDERIIKTLNKFPFSSEETSDLPVLKIKCSSESDRVIVPGFSKTLPALAVEKIMDGVLIARANFEDIYKYGPVKRTTVYSAEPSYQKGYKTYDFLISLNGGREYIVTKGVEYTSYIRDGRSVEKKESIHYTASLCEDDLMTQIVMGEDATNDFGLENL